MEEAPLLKDAEACERIASEGMILRVMVGSTVHGLELAGTDDRDEMAIAIPPPEYVLGHARFEHWVHRTAPDGQRSGPDDLDLVVYSLLKYIRLAGRGSPTVMLPLFAVGDDLLFTTPVGDRLRELAPSFLSKKVAAAFLGYMRAQRERLVGERGGRNVRREHLVGQYGFDTKYAMHTLRLGYQGLELLETGKLSLPMNDPARSHILRVRVGDVPLEDVIEEATELEEKLRQHAEASDLPDSADWTRIDKFVVDAHLNWWHENASTYQLRTTRS